MMHAGQWDCSVDWGAFYDEHKVWMDEDLLSIIGVLMSTTTGDFFTDGYVSCPSSCTGTDTETCACTSAIHGISTADDVDDLTMVERMNYLSSVWTSIGAKSIGADQYTVFVKAYDVDGTTFNNVFVPVHTKGPDADNLPMDNAKLDLLNKLMLKTILFQGSYGIMMSGAATADPIFWVMHALFDKATHALRLSSRYNTGGFTWNNVAGMETYRGATPFTRLDFEPYLGSSIKTKGEYLHNDELWELIHPTSEAVYHIYDQFTEWGNVNFDPFASRTD
mmetsp:Transcript_30571/g.39395  ORF Transcript_30571/g.39395 Transcript_30571/m.39395 type:complete len:278 (+) Transcript_30571:2-835(+)